VSATGYALAFGGGVVSFLSPCVLPLVPPYLSLTSGAGLSGRPSGRVAALRTGALFVSGFSAVFVLLGLSATVLGSLLLRAQVPITRLAGFAVVGMAIIMLLASQPAGRFASREFRFRPQLARYGTWAAPVAGAAFGFGWTPCIGPVLGSVLAVAADQRRLGSGALLLASYAAGLAVPFLVAALALDRSLAASRLVRRHSAALLLGSATVLGAYGVLLALDRLSTVTVQLQQGMTALGLGRLVGLG
jgi:cytochrome c-type biogenesis protein